MGDNVDLAEFARSKGVRLNNDDSPAGALLPINHNMSDEEKAKATHQNSNRNDIVFHGALPPEYHTSPEYEDSMFSSRRDYFYHASLHYGLDIDEIQERAFMLGVNEDFNKLVEWMKAEEKRRRKSPIHE